MDDRDFEKRKSVLELRFQTYLQYKIITLSGMIGFLIAIVIAFITNQLKIYLFIDWFFIGIISIAVFGMGILLIDIWHDHLEGIIEEIKKL